MGMPTTRSAPQQNRFTAPPPPLENLPPDLKGRNPESFNPVIRMQNIPLSSLPSNTLPPGVTTQHTRQATTTSNSNPLGRLDPETGDWASETPGKRSSRSSKAVTPDRDSSRRDSSRENTPLKSSRHNTQVGHTTF